MSGVRRRLFEPQVSPNNVRKLLKSKSPDDLNKEDVYLFHAAYRVKNTLNKMYKGYSSNLDAPSEMVMYVMFLGSKKSEDMNTLISRLKNVQNANINDARQYVNALTNTDKMKNFIVNQTLAFYIEYKLQGAAVPYELTQRNVLKNKVQNIRSMNIKNLKSYYADVMHRLESIHIPQVEDATPKEVMMTYTPPNHFLRKKRVNQSKLEARATQRTRKLIDNFRKLGSDSGHNRLYIELIRLKNKPPKKYLEALPGVWKRTGAIKTKTSNRINLSKTKSLKHDVKVVKKKSGAGGMPGKTKTNVGPMWWGPSFVKRKGNGINQGGLTRNLYSNLNKYFTRGNTAALKRLSNVRNASYVLVKPSNAAMLGKIMGRILSGQENAVRTFPISLDPSLLENDSTIKTSNINSKLNLLSATRPELGQKLKFWKNIEDYNHNSLNMKKNEFNKATKNIKTTDLNTNTKRLGFVNAIANYHLLEQHKAARKRFRNAYGPYQRGYIYNENIKLNQIPNKLTANEVMNKTNMKGNSAAFKNAYKRALNDLGEKSNLLEGWVRYITGSNSLPSGRKMEIFIQRGPSSNEVKNLSQTNKVFYTQRQTECRASTCFNQGTFVVPNTIYNKKNDVYKHFKNIMMRNAKSKMTFGMA